MRTIPAEIVHQAWERLTDISEEEVRALLERMAKRQPALVAYLAASDEEWMETEAEQGKLVFLGLIIWEIMSAEESLLHEVTPEALEAAEDANLEFLEERAEDSEAGYMDALKTMVATYSQRPLLAAVLEALMEGNEEEPELAGENVGLAFLTLKTAMDCLDQ